MIGKGGRGAWETEAKTGGQKQTQLPKAGSAGRQGAGKGRRASPRCRAPTDEESPKCRVPTGEGSPDERFPRSGVPQMRGPTDKGAAT